MLYSDYPGQQPLQPTSTARCGLGLEGSTQLTQNSTQHWATIHTTLLTQAVCTNQLLRVSLPPKSEKSGKLIWVLENHQWHQQNATQSRPQRYTLISVFLYKTHWQGVQWQETLPTCSLAASLPSQLIQLIKLSINFHNETDLHDFKIWLRLAAMKYLCASTKLTGAKDRQRIENYWENNTSTHRITCSLQRILLHLLWLPYGIGQAIIFLPCDFYLLSFFFFFFLA